MAFKIIETWIEGQRPGMLQNRATAENLAGGGTRNNNPSIEEDPRDICERAVYRMPEDSRQLCVPGGAFARMLREAGGSHKAKGTRKSLKYVIPAAVLVLDDLCGLYLPDRKTRLVDYEVDSRPVTIPATKGRIMRHRARFNQWSCSINLRIDETILGEEIVRKLFAEGCQQIGIGDFRPERGGPFGTSAVVSWRVIEERPLTVAQRRNSGKRPDPELRT